MVFKSILGNRQAKMEQMLREDPKLQQLYREIDDSAREMSQHLDNLLKHSRGQD